MEKQKCSYQLAMLIKEVYLMSMSSMEEQISKFGITPQQLITIKLIAHNNGMQHSDLCREMNLSKGTVSGIIKRLMEKGMVEKKPIDSDKRNNIIVFTDKGREFAYSIRHEMNDTFKNIFKTSSEDDIQRYIDTLKEMIYKMKGST
ncbi:MULTISPECIES: MarR family winged helix-turn-helix transcriptional regulator [Clostridium]|uniref:DNA-binding transcriptional regulator, MarR family n=1 Tax=Clostridium cadaveris TaxID=1529 RepID=A0A1I2K4T7_9CLOT|nr:MarR family winged helix-turn-helix transcriptional regulator [Clostridium cadaveris]MDU4950865.1 MarR family winged helix-turn-helix transcriptional regulator [Clostridium sp.]MDM8310893.1 MarR family winged helix-turn-helix transcriptional regulator [Clostridium cadaveris]MDY4949186.1 MarR family winged helix-turn-helix transcriptional regulator [Clostridium cadaveris]NME63386.1 winged helix-turn-helix transcriptional regulator [Clostridium cadaveris]NWK11511.1 winged helix-turn-helix tra